VPARLGSEPPVPGESRRPLRRGLLRPLARIEAHDHDVEFTPRVEREGFEAADETIQDLRTEHGTCVIDQRQNDRALPEQAVQGHDPARVVAERDVERDPLVEPLIETDLAKNGGHSIRRHAW
jgi:hypothetical protein